MKLSEYQELAKNTDQYPNPTGLDKFIVPLGLLGELGSVATVWKKKNRDKDAYTNYSEGVLEELGDLLWYVSTLASRKGIQLRDQYSSIGSLEFGQIPDLILGMQQTASKILLPGCDPDLIHKFLGDLESLAQASGKTLNVVAELNHAKTVSRWLLDSTPAPFLDEGYPLEERLPRKLTIQFQEKRSGSKAVVLMRVRDLNIGDRITDNAEEPDGYRFHDVFHWAHVAVLGWSPVIRALLRAKRKSNPVVDEVQDGARAQIVEEAISIQIFNYARDHSMLKDLKRVDHDLLISICRMTRGLESERCSPREWEMAILKGYNVFRRLRENGGGTVQIDMDKRDIQFLE